MIVGDTLGSLLCIYVKGMHEVQRLISTSLLDIYNWIKYIKDNLKCSRARVTNELTDFTHLNSNILLKNFKLQNLLYT